MAESDLYRTLGASVAARRKALKLTQASVALEIGLTRASLANIESGRQKVLLHHVYRLANVLQVRNVTELIPGAFDFELSTEAVPLPEGKGTTGQRAQVAQLIQHALKAATPR